MLSAAPTPPPPPPPVRTDSRPLEPNEQWKADLRRRIEFGLRHMVEDAQNVRDTILSSQPSESSRERAQREYEESMNNIRMLAQEEFNRDLRVEMSERKWALDVVDSNSPDVVRQQQWILDNIRKADDDLNHMPFANPDAPQNPEGVLSASPQEQGDSERASDESLEGGYGSTIPEDEGSGSDQSMESEEGEDEDEEEEEEEGEGGGDVQPRQSRPPSRPNVSLTQPLHSRSPVSRRDAQSRQRQPSNFRSAEGHDDEDAGDSPTLARPARPREGQPYSPGGPPRRQSSGSQAPVWSRVPRPSEPSGISRTLAHANGQMYSPSPVQFPRRGSVNSTGSNSSGAGLHRAGSLNSDQHRSGSVAPHNPHNGTERLPSQARDRIVSNIGTRERQMSASGSPHDRPSPPTYPTVAPRAIPGARPPPLDDAVRFPTSASPGSRPLFSMQRSPEDMRQGMAIPRGPTTPEEGPRGASWSSLHSRRSYGDFNVHRRHNSKGDPRLPPVDGDISDASDDVVGQLDDRQSLRSVRSVRSVRSMELEQMALYWEAEAHRKEEEATRKEEEASKKEDEARRLEEKARQSLEDAKRLEEGARQVEASAKMREAAAQKKEAEAKLKEAEAQKREAAAQKREAEAQRKEDMARQMERAARRKEEQARSKEEEAQRKEEEARKREDEVRRKEDDARKREDDARKREEDAREREKLARQKEEDARRFEEDARRKEDEARRKREEAKRLEQDYEQKKREIERKEAELKIREAELFRKEQAALVAQEEFEARRPADETPQHEFEVTSPIDAEEVTFEDFAKADAYNRTPDDSARQAQDPESTAPEQEKHTKSKGRKGSKSQAKRQKEKALEEQRQKEQEQQYLEEQRLLEEKRLEEERLRREREAQIRLDEEISRQEQMRLHREAVLEQERLQREAEEQEANRIREEQLRAAEEARYRQLEEQRRKTAEQSRQRDELRHQQQHQQQHQQDEVARQHVKEQQQKEFQRREAQYYQRTLERERQNSMGSSFEVLNAHRSGSTTATAGSAGDRSSASSTSTFSSSTGSTSSRPSSMNSSHTSNSSFSSSSVPLSSTPRPSPTSARPGAPGTSPFAAKLDEAEWARRAEERARQQQEQFKREQERLESERQSKSTKVLSRDELIRLYENHENKWRQLKDSDNLGWNSFAWPVFRRPSEPEEMTSSGISAYVQSKYAPGAERSPKDRIKDHLKRWHPDKFETRILPRVAEEEREKVKTGAGIVVRGLNELLNRNYED